MTKIFEVPQCRFVKKDDARCSKAPIANTDFCYLHGLRERRGISFYLTVVSLVVTVVLSLAGIALGYYSWRYPVVTQSPDDQSSLQSSLIKTVSDKVVENVLGRSTPTPAITPQATPMRTPAPRPLKKPQRKQLRNKNVVTVDDRPTALTLEPRPPQGETCPAWTVPVFNPYALTFDDKNTPYCRDFPMIDVAMDEDSPKWSQSLSEHQAPHKFKVGDQFAVGLYIDNGGLDEAKYTAKDVRIMTAISGSGGAYTITTTFSAENAESKSGSIAIQISPGARLEPVQESGGVFDYFGRLILNQQNLELANTTLRLGDLDAGFEYSLFFTFKVRVVG